MIKKIGLLNENNIVTEVITGIDEDKLIEGLDPETWYGNFRNQKCVRTSFNSKIRNHFAGVGMSYDPIADVFISPMPECGHDELILNELKRWECTNVEHADEIS